VKSHYRLVLCVIFAFVMIHYPPWSSFCKSMCMIYESTSGNVSLFLFSLGMVYIMYRVGDGLTVVKEVLKMPLHTLALFMHLYVVLRETGH